MLRLARRFRRDVRELLARVLRQIEGLDVITADGGPRAMDLVATRRPSLVLLHIAMPGMDGFTVLERLRDLHDGLRPPVVRLTAANDDASRAGARARFTACGQCSNSSAWATATKAAASG